MLFIQSTTREIYELIAKRNQPMLAALEMCVEQLERFGEKGPDIECALRCARRALQIERTFRENAPKD